MNTQNPGSPAGSPPLGGAPGAPAGAQAGAASPAAPGPTPAAAPGPAQVAAPGQQPGGPTPPYPGPGGIGGGAGHAGLTIPSINPPAISRFFLWMSKTDVQGLAHCSYEALATQTSLGAMVCLSGLFAFFSSFFLVYSITEGHISAAWLAPVLYAMAIIVFDRELVGFTPAAELSWPMKVLQMLPRLFMATIIGFAIAIPMEHKLMERAIEEEIRTSVAKSASDLIDRSAAVRKEIEDTRQQFRQELEGARGRLAKVEERLHKEYIDRGGKGPIYASLEAERNREKEAVQIAESRFASYHGDPAQVAAAGEADRVVAARLKQVRTDILARTEALERITERSAAAATLEWVVRFVFIALELFPMILKLFLKYNEYHAYLETRRCLAITKTHVLGDHAMDYIKKNPGQAARMEFTDLMQVSGEDSIGTHHPYGSGYPSASPPLVNPNPYAHLAPKTSGTRSP